MCDTELRQVATGVPLHSPKGPESPMRAIQIQAAKVAAEQKRLKAIDALQKAMVFCLFFMCCELLGGYFAHSLAILTDAAHLLTDVGGFGLSIFSLKATAKAACNRYSFGWHRAEVVGTLASLLTMWGLICIIFFEACNRILEMYRCSQSDVVPINPQHLGFWKNLTSTDPAVLRVVLADGTVCEAVQAPLMVLIGTLGLAVNMICATILTMGGTHGHSHSAGSHGHSHGSSSPAAVGKSELAHSPPDERAGDSQSGHDYEDGHDHGNGHDHDHGHNNDHGHAHDQERGDESHGHSHGGGRGAALNSAFLHALGDCVQSVGVIIAAVVIWYFNYSKYGSPSHPASPYNLADPLSSIFFGVVTLYWTRGLLRQVLRVLMESAPDEVDAAAVGAKLAAIPGVVEVHHLHIWSLSLEKPSLSVHLVASDHCGTLKRAQEVCEGFGIVHHTIQVDGLDVGADRCDADLGCVASPHSASSAHGT